MKLKANAKVNLLLDVTGIKENGYHSLFTIMQSISLSDIITVDRIDGDEIVISCDTEGVPTDSSNIVYKCAERFFEYVNIITNKGIHIHIEKNIPFGAGMGGGSADGAAVLVALNKLFCAGLSERELCRIGARVGADIPFCVVGGTGLCLDTGVIVAPLTDVENVHFVVVMPDESVSTKGAYAALDAVPYLKHPKNQQMLELISDGDTTEALKLCANVFEQAIEVPGRVDIKAVCNNGGAVATCMTGSGSAVYSVFEDEKTAKTTAEQLKEKFSNIFLCSPQKLGVEIIEE
jgi:4-diphosphocytidyl-2-C-methyl-D-erythritol kinase